MNTPIGVAKSPRIIFSRWLPWGERDTLANGRKPGIYMLAHFDTPRTEKRANWKDPSIVYIGKSWDKGGIVSRLDTFDKRANSRKAKHSGGKNYQEEYGRIRDDLYFAICPLDFETNEVVRNTFILYLERKLIWEFAVTHGRRPKCNRE